MSTVWTTSKADRSTDKFCEDIGLTALIGKIKHSQPGWSNPPNYGNQRVQWIGRQSQVETFWNFDSSQVLIMECVDIGDGITSPMTFSATCHVKAYKDRVEAYGLMLPGLHMPDLSTQECFTYMCGRILKNGFDPDVNLSKFKGNSASQALLAALIMSHLKVSEVVLILIGVGVYERDAAAITEWYKLCKAFVGLTKQSLPGLKPFRLLIINPEKSEAVTRVKGEYPDIPFLKVLTGAEYVQKFPKGLPALDKKGKKGKGKKT